MSFQFELDPKDEAVADLVAAVGKSLQRAISARGATQAEIANKLEVDRSRVNKCLSGFNNLTLKSIAELVWAIDGTVRVDIALNQVAQNQAVGEDINNVVAFAERREMGKQEQSAPEPDVIQRAVG